MTRDIWALSQPWLVDVEAKLYFKELIINKDVLKIFIFKNVLTTNQTNYLILDSTSTQLVAASAIPLKEADHEGGEDNDKHDHHHDDEP